MTLLINVMYRKISFFLEGPVSNPIEASSLLETGTPVLLSD